MEGRDEEDLENAEAWAAKVDSENIRCSRCSSRIPYGEQDLYYDRGICSWCAKIIDKED